MNGRRVNRSEGGESLFSPVNPDRDVAKGGCMKVIKINLCASERLDLLEACRVAIRYNQKLLYSEKWTSNYSPYDEDDLNEEISRLQELQVKLMGAVEEVVA
jgi:hypothetical protein